MGFMDKVRGQFIDIVEFLDDSRDTLVWRFPRQGNEIKMGAQLVVREGQVAVFVNEGEIADVFTPGHLHARDENLPILSDLKGWKYGFSSPFKAEVYFVGTRQFTDLKWGTQNPVMVRDAEFGVVRLRAFGTYSLQVVDAARLLRQLVGTDPQFRTDEVSEFLRQNIVSQVGTALASSNLPMLDLAANQQTIAATLAGIAHRRPGRLRHQRPAVRHREHLAAAGGREQALDKRTQMGVLGDLDQYAKFQAANAIGDAANNPGGAGRGARPRHGHGARPADGPVARARGRPWQRPRRGRRRCPAAPARPGSWPSAGSRSVRSTAADLPARVGSGELTPTTLVWQQGMAAWTAAAEVPALAGLLAAIPPPLPPATPDTRRPRRRPEPADRDDRERAGDPRPGPLTSTCPACGAQTAYAPGTTELRCGSCGTGLEIAAPEVAIQEHSYDEWRARSGGGQVAAVGAHVLRCGGCGASTETVDLAGTCQFCGGALVGGRPAPGRGGARRPSCRSTSTGAAPRTAFGRWVRSRRFAPGALKRVGSTEGLSGTYVPHWTFDAAHRDRLRRPARRALLGDRDLPGAGRQGRHPDRDAAGAAHPLVPRIGTRRARSFDDVLVVGTHRLDAERPRGDGAVDAGCGPSVPAGVPHRLLRAAVRRRAGRRARRRRAPGCGRSSRRTAATTSAATSSGSPTST